MWRERQIWRILDIIKQFSMSVFSHEDNSSRTSNSHNVNPYLFQLEGKKGSYFVDPISSDFSPVRALELFNKNQQLISYSIIPTFNADGRFYSQAFLVPFQGLEADSAMLTRHESRLREVSVERTSSEILLPKPRKNHYCYVCRMEFNDYLQHTQDGDHKRAVKKSKYHQHIMELAKMFERTKGSHKPKDHYTLRNRTASNRGRK